MLSAEGVDMYDDILVPTDGSDGARRALEEAIELAAQFDATVHSLYVVDTTAAYSDGAYGEVIDSFEAIGAETTDDAVERAGAAGVDAVGAVELGTPHRTILDYVDEHGVDLVVMGTHGRTGLDRYLLGSVTEKVVRLADPPVVTVRAGEAE
jgi:nucleotide-binding universal stress UspA family protein